MRRKTYVVTGANSDIGAEVCKLILQAGNRVVALYHLNKERLDAFDASDGALISISIDFADPNNVESFIEEYKYLLREVDSFVGLAAIRHEVRYGEITAKDLMQHFTVNVVPHVLLMQFLGAQMALKKWGRIVMGSSIGVKFGGSDDSYCYSLSKMAGELIPKAARKWSEKNVLTNVVRIGVTDTAAFRKIGRDQVKYRSELIPMKRLACPYEMANTIYWLASDQNTYITGQIIPVSGGE